MHYTLICLGSMQAERPPLPLLQVIAARMLVEDDHLQLARAGAGCCGYELPTTAVTPMPAAYFMLQ